MIINNILFNCELIEILTELQNQLRINNIPLLQVLKDSNSDIMVQCPFHKNGTEKKPSAGIRKSDGQFHCFTCSTTKSLQEVISYCFGYTDDYLGVNGWKWLQKNFLSVSVYDRKGIELNLSRKKEEKKIQYVGEEELESYRYIHPYMYKRKLTDEIIEMFDIGYDADSQCIIFPVRDIQGRCLFAARRSVISKWFNYPSGAEKPLYGIYEISQLKSIPKEIIVTESMLDCLTCWVYGKPAIALNGLGSFQQYKELEQLPCRTLILATDDDDAGRKARKRIKENVKYKLIMQYKTYNGKKDINELTKEEFDKLEVIM